MISGSYTSLQISNVDTIPGYTNYYTIDNGATFIAIGNGIISGLNLNTKYTIFIESISPTGTVAYKSDNSNSIQLGIPTPSKPTLSVITGSYTTLLLGNVDSTPGVTYHFRLNTFPTGQYNPITDLAPSGSGYTVAGLLPNTDYSISIVAKVGSVYGSESIYSDPAVRTATIPKPSTPTLSLISGSYTSLLLGNVDSLSEYTYYYRLNTHPLGQYTAISTLEISGSGYIVKGLVPDQDYTIGIIAKIQGVYGPESIYSSPAIRIPLSALTKPSTPTLQTILGSLTTLLLGNVDSAAGVTYYYRLNTHPIGQFTPIANLDKSGNGYIVKGLVANQDYTIGIVAKVGSVYGPESTYSDPAVRTALIPKPSTPTLSLIPGSYTSLLLGNVDSTPGYSYYYTLNTQSAGTYTAITGLEKSGSGYIVPNLVEAQDYTIGITAKADGLYGQTSTYSLTIIRIPYALGTILYSFPDNPLPVNGFTLTKEMYFSASLRATGSFSYRGGYEGGRIDINSVKLPVGAVISPNINPIFRRSLDLWAVQDGVDCSINISINNVVKAGITAQGGMGNQGNHDPPYGGIISKPGSGGISPDDLNISEKATIITGGGTRGNIDTDFPANGSYSIKLIPVTPTTYIPSMPTLSIIPNSYTSLMIGNIDSNPAYTYYYSIDNGKNFIAVGTGIITGVLPLTQYTAYMQARDMNGVITGISFPSASITISIPKPSTPTLTWIPGSDSLLLGNIDTVPGVTYYYTLNTQSAGTYTEIAGLEKSGSGYIVPNLVFNQDYTIGITAKVGGIYGPISTYSSPAVRLSISTPTLAVIPNSNFLTLGGIDNLPGYTYEYSMDGGITYNSVTGPTIVGSTITGLKYNTSYNVYIRAKSGNTVVATSNVSNSVTTRYPAGTFFYRYGQNSLPANGFTLTQPMYLECTLVGAGSGWIGSDVTRGWGGTIVVRTPGVLLDSGLTLTANSPNAGVRFVNVNGQMVDTNGDSCNLTISKNGVTQSLISAGGGRGSTPEGAPPLDNPVSQVMPDILGITPYAVSGMMASLPRNSGYYIIILIPADVPVQLDYATGNNPIPANGFTLTRPMYLSCTLNGAGSGEPLQHLSTAGYGSSIVLPAPGVLLDSGLTLTANSPNAGTTIDMVSYVDYTNGDNCNLTISKNGVTQSLLSAAGGAAIISNQTSSYIAPDILGITPYVSFNSEAGSVTKQNGSYTIRLIPA
jgi:hypothetical protein